MKEIQKLKKKNAENKIKEDNNCNNNDDEIEDDGDDDGEDSDYEYTGGDMAIYDSALDDADELLFIKDTLERINNADIGYFNGLFSGLN